MPLLRHYLDVSTLTSTTFKQSLSLLPTSTHAHITRYHFPTDQHLSLGSALLQRHTILTHYASYPTLASIPLTKSRTTGRPLHTATGPLRGALAVTDYNTTHHNPRLESPAGEKCIVAVAALLSPVPSSAHRVGVDVVPTHHRADGAEDFVNTFCGEEDAAAVFTPREIRIIMEYPTLAERVRCVYLHWALKEAYTKATGVGIVDDLTRIEFRGVRFGWEERWTGASVWVDGVDMSSEWYLEVSFMPGRTAPGEGFYLAVCCSREAVGEEDLEGEWKELRLEDIANPVV